MSDSMAIAIVGFSLLVLWFRVWGVEKAQKDKIKKLEERLTAMGADPEALKKLEERIVALEVNSEETRYMAGTWLS